MKSLLVFLAVGSISSMKLPDGLKFCHKSDPNFNECFKNALIDGVKIFKDGFKPIGIPLLDPITIPEITTELSSGLAVTLKNVQVFGFPSSVITSMNLDFDKLRMDFDLELNRQEFIADYSLKGKLLTFDLDASGKCDIVADKVAVQHRTKFERFEKDGKKHLRFVEWKLRAQPGAIHFDFDNIVPGNKELSDIIMKAVNENAADIYQQVGPVLEDTVAQIHLMLVNKFFEKMPEDEVFLP